MRDFDVRVYKFHGMDYLSFTRNGYHREICLHNPEKEIPLIIGALTDCLKGIYRIGPPAKEKL